MDEDIKEYIFRLLDDEVLRGELENWAYTTSGLEAFIGSNYIELISLDYRSEGVVFEAKNLLSKHINQGEYLDWHLKKHLTAILQRTENVYINIYHLYDLYCQGFEFLEALAMDFCIYIGDPAGKISVSSRLVWADLSARQKDDLVNSLYPEIIEHAKRVIDCLNDGSIRIIGYLAENVGLEKTSLISDLEKENNTLPMVLENGQAIQVVPHVYKTYHYSRRFEYVDGRPTKLKKAMYTKRGTISIPKVRLSPKSGH